MKRNLLAVLLCLMALPVFSQNDIPRLMKEGVALHDEGKFDEAIRKYDSVLAIDANYYDAMFEKSYTLTMNKGYDECIVLCKRMLAMDPKNTNTRGVYVNWGTALDDKGDPEEAIKVYTEGIGKFPDYYLLHFNKGVTLMLSKKNEEAMLCYQDALKLKPLHASSHQFSGRIMASSNRIASILSFFSFLVIEPQGDRAKQNYQDLTKLVLQGISTTNDGKNVNINIDASVLDKSKKKTDDNFASAELLFSMSSALDNDEKFKDENAGARLFRKMESLVSMLKEQKSGGSGFYWKFYVPFFIEMKDKDQLETACYLATVNADDAAVMKWLGDNKEKIEGFYGWLKEYKWK